MADPSSSGSNPTDPFVTSVTLFQRLASDSPTQRERAWTDFHKRYRPIIQAFARRCGANREDTDDIVQDVLAAFVGTSTSFVYDPTRGSFRGWLKTVTVRTALRRAGKRMRLGQVPLDQVPEPETAVEPTWNDVWESQSMDMALGMLRGEEGNSPAMRAFEQYALLGRDANDVAKELGISVDSVYQAKSRLTRRLRDIVDRLRND